MRRKLFKATKRAGWNFTVAIIFLAATQFGDAQSGASKADIEKRVDSVLGQMTLDEKIEMLGGINDLYTRPIPRLGVPSLRMSDGPMGVHDYGLTTAYPAGIALAASWDVNLAERFGTAMGKDARARGVHFIWSGHEYLSRADEWAQLRVLRGRSVSGVENGGWRDSGHPRAAGDCDSQALCRK